MTETRKMPPLGGGSVDFNAVHDADMKGKDLVEAIENATTRPVAPEPPKAANPGSESGTGKPARPTPSDPPATGAGD